MISKTNPLPTLAINDARKLKKIWYRIKYKNYAVTLIPIWSDKNQIV